MLHGLLANLPPADAFMPRLAPFVLLAFFGAAFLIFSSAVVCAFALAARRFGLAKISGGAGLGVAAAYGMLLIGASLFSGERTLRAGEKKYFCEMDCHLAYSVVAAPSSTETSRAVTVRTWFDPSTIASFRGNGPLSPNPRKVYLVDESGRRYQPSAAAAQEWEVRHGRSTPLTRELRPGESYDTTFVFEVPRGASHLLFFFIGDTLGPENLLIGHENSPLHGKIYFELPDVARAGAQRTESTRSSRPDRISERRALTAALAGEPEFGRPARVEDLDLPRGRRS